MPSAGGQKRRRKSDARREKSLARARRKWLVKRLGTYLGVAIGWPGLSPGALRIVLCFLGCMHRIACGHTSYLLALRGAKSPASTCLRSNRLKQRLCA